ncbi:MAG: hypothetical protein Q4G04_01455 [bacterium]|nr:hypothetical protein [bacterium]
MRIYTTYDKNEIKFLNSLLINMKIYDMYFSSYYKGIKLYDMCVENPNYSNKDAIEFLMEECLAFSNACLNDEQKDYLLEICDKYDYDYMTFCPDKELEIFCNQNKKQEISDIEI